jgi:hypothetical protein
MARQNYIPHTPTQGRANRFPVGGVYSKIWAPFHSRAPQKKIFRKAKIFPENVGDGGGEGVLGGGQRYFFENKSSRNLSQNNFFPECQGPLPASWGPLFTFLGGVTPPHPPGGTALPPPPIAGGSAAPV